MTAVNNKATKPRASPPRRMVDVGMLDDEAHVRIDVVSRETSLAQGTIRNLMTKGQFPYPVPKIGPGPNYWRLGDIREWLRNNRGKRTATNGG